MRQKPNSNMNLNGRNLKSFAFLTCKLETTRARALTILSTTFVLLGFLEKSDQSLAVNKDGYATKLLFSL